MVAGDPMGVAMDIGLRRDGVGILTLSNASTGAGVSFAAPTLIAGSGVSSATPLPGPSRPPLGWEQP